MKIARLDAFQLQWSPSDNPDQRSAFLRVYTDDGRVGIGEASPMRGGVASLAILNHHIAPAVIGADPLDHATIQDRLVHRLVKLGPEGALTGALAALDIALWDLKGKLLGQPIYKLLGGRLAHRPAVLCFHRPQRRAQRRRSLPRGRAANEERPGGGQDPLR
jgi:L-alanine-DL-glutamate epimerase-like enolase superfamily enzyme